MRRGSQSPSGVEDDDQEPDDPESLGLNAIVQVVWLSAAPLWALMIIYQLCVNWEREGSGA